MSCCDDVGWVTYPKLPDDRVLRCVVEVEVVVLVLKLIVEVGRVADVR